MLLAFVLVIVLIILASWGRQAWWALRLAIRYPARPRATDASCPPKVVVFLPLRGPDPLVRDCLEGLLAQDYPNYEIRIIVDDKHDPVWATVRDVLSAHPDGPVRTAVLSQRLDTCSLKVSALLQGIDGLDDSIDVVALLDADVLPPPHWLRELVHPFRDPRIGATSGLRWYHTHNTLWGSLVRGLWGAGAAAQMYNLDILWGGTMAFRASLLREPELRQLWAHSFVEDTSVVSYLRARGLQVRFLPVLTMINPEAISLAGVFRFIRRQILCVRLHHPSWPQVLWTTIGMLVSLPLTMLGTLLAWSLGEPWLAWTLLGTLLATILAAGLPLAWIDGCFYFASPPDNRLAPISIKHLPVVPLTLLVQQAAVLSACRAREIDWRGIHYTIGPEGVRRLNDGPYVVTQPANDQAESIV